MPSCQSGSIQRRSEQSNALEQRRHSPGAADGLASSSAALMNSVVVEPQRVVRVLGRIDVDDLQQRRRLLADHQALALDFRRQQWRRELGTVLHIHGIDVGIGAEREGDGERVAAVPNSIPTGRVEHIVDAGDLLFDRLGDRLLQDLGISLGIGSVVSRPAATRSPGTARPGCSGSRAVARFRR